MRRYAYYTLSLVAPVATLEPSGFPPLRHLDFVVAMFCQYICLACLFDFVSSVLYYMHVLGALDSIQTVCLFSIIYLDLVF